MPEKRSETFGRLLKAGLNSIATIEGRTGPVVDEEVGAAVGLAGTSLQRYRSGHLPSDYALTARFAELCVARGLMGRPWLEQFLKAARFPAFEGRALAARLFPDAPAPARAPAPQPNLPPPTFARYIMRRAAYEATLGGLASSMPLTAIVSMGGMGKTSLARVVAGDCLEGRARPRFAAVVWLSDKDRPGATGLSSALDELARVLDYPGVAGLPFAEKQREAERLLRAQPVLLVLDNAETVTDLALLEWLARLPAPSKALLTSRAAPPAHAPCRLVELPPLDDAQSRELIGELLAHSSLAATPATLDQLRPLATAAGGNPKAIELALGLARRQPLAEIVAALEAASLADLFTPLFERAWRLLDADAARALLALTLFPGSAAEAALAFVAELPAAELRRAAARLADLSLLDVERADLLAPARYDAHPLVRAFAAARRAERPDEERALHERWVAWCADLAGSVGFCWSDLDRLDRLDAEHETAQAALEWASHNGYDREALRLCEGLRYYYNVRGLWDERRLKNYDYRSLAAQTRGNTSELVLGLAQLAEIHTKQGRFDDAESWLQDAEGIAASDPPDPASLAERAAAFADAEERFDAPELNDDARFELGHARALLAHARGDLAGAEARWRALLPFSATLDAQKHVINRRWLATCLLEQGRAGEAEQLYRASLDDARRAGDTRSVTGNTLKLAAIDLARGELAAAAAALDECRKVAARYNDRRRLAECHRLSARLRGAQGDEPGRRAELEQAADLFARMGMRREAEATQGELARARPGSEQN